MVSQNSPFFDNARRDIDIAARSKAYGRPTSSHCDTTPALEPIPSSLIIGARVHATDYAGATRRVLAWAGRAESRYVCAANVHMVMESRDSPDFRAVVNSADLVTSDGMPLVWLLRRHGHRDAERVYGPDLMLHILAAAASAGLPVAFFGASTEVLQRLLGNLRNRFPTLEVAAAIAPPFGPELVRRDGEMTERLSACGARIVFVGLGCPKQEKWMAAHRGRIPAVMVGVGAGFNFHAGSVRQSPKLLQRMGLEWAFRLAMEPRRLWRRYLVLNPRFVAGVLLEECRRVWQRRSRKGAP